MKTMSDRQLGRAFIGLLAVSVALRSLATWLRRIEEAADAVA